MAKVILADTPYSNQQLFALAREYVAIVAERSAETPRLRKLRGRGARDAVITEATARLLTPGIPYVYCALFSADAIKKIGRCVALSDFWTMGHKERWKRTVNALHAERNRFIQQTALASPKPPGWQAAHDDPYGETPYPKVDPALVQELDRFTDAGQRNIYGPTQMLDKQMRETAEQLMLDIKRKHTAAWLCELDEWAQTLKPKQWEIVWRLVWGFSYEQIRLTTCNAQGKMGASERIIRPLREKIRELADKHSCAADVEMADRIPKLQPGVSNPEIELPGGPVDDANPHETVLHEGVIGGQRSVIVYGDVEDDGRAPDAPEATRRDTADSANDWGSSRADSGGARTISDAALSTGGLFPTREEQTRGPGAAIISGPGTDILAAIAAAKAAGIDTSYTLKQAVSPDPDDPCLCKSGLRFRNCCARKISATKKQRCSTRATRKRGSKNEQKRYIASWKDELGPYMTALTAKVTRQKRWLKLGAQLGYSEGAMLQVIANASRDGMLAALDSLLMHTMKKGSGGTARECLDNRASDDSDAEGRRVLPALSQRSIAGDLADSRAAAFGAGNAAVAAGLVNHAKSG
jgi:hypothetical protein